MAKPKTRTHRRTPSIDLPVLVELVKPILVAMNEETARREAKRLEVFERAFAQASSTAQRVALASAYLGK